MKPMKVSRTKALVQDRDRMIAGNIGLVHHIALRMARSAAPQAELNDLVGGGTIGLIQAVDSFNPSQGVAFSTYAAPRIRGAMLDDMRQCDHASRGSRRQQRDIQRTERTLRAGMARAPQHGEVARAMGVEPETLWRWKSNGADAVHVSLDAGAAGHSLMDTIPGMDVGDGEGTLERAEQLSWLKGRIAALEDRERMVLALYYARGLRLREIAEVLGVTESRVSQIRTSVLARLKAQWKAETQR
jgi:RNA polymerase sigma factor for flagellar operon FliA